MISWIVSASRENKAIHEITQINTKLVETTEVYRVAVNTTKSKRVLRFNVITLGAAFHVTTLNELTAESASSSVVPDIEDRIAKDQAAVRSLASTNLTVDSHKPSSIARRLCPSHQDLDTP